MHDWLTFDTDDRRFTFWSTMPPAPPEQFRAIKVAVANDTWTGRIIVDEIGRILFGHDDYRAFRRLGKPVKHVFVAKVGDRTKAEIEALIRLWRLCDGRPAGADEHSQAAAAAGIAGVPIVYAKNRSQARKYGELLLRTGGLPGLTMSPRTLGRRHWQQERDRMAQMGKKLATPDDIHLFAGDFCNLDAWLAGLGIEPGTADVFWTDIEWRHDALSLYPRLAAMGQVWLKSGGLFCIYTGTVHEDEANDMLRAHFGQRRKRLLVLNKERGTSRRVGSTQSCYQSILVFSKGEPVRKLDFADVCEAPRIERRYHDMERTEDETLHWLTRVAGPGQVVVDPFGGGFTTAVACLKLGLRCVSCDIEERFVNIGKYRVATTWEEMQATRQK